MLIHQFILQIRTAFMLLGFSLLGFSLLGFSLLGVSASTSWAETATVNSVTLQAVEQDYMQQELRQQVEALKAASRVEPTSSSNARTRAKILWQWVNSYALAGGYVPVNLTAALRVNSNQTVTKAAAKALDDYIIELTLLDEEPAAIGSLTATTGPFEVRGFATIQQTYTVGTRPISPGGGFAVAKHFMTDNGLFQTTDPSRANFVDIATSNNRAHFVQDSVPITGMHGGFRGAEPVLFFRLAAGRLNPGDTVTITYGARSGDGPGMQLPSFSSDRMPFPLYVDFDGRGPLFSLPIQPIRVQGRAVAGVHGFAPSVVRPGESFELSIRAQDEFYNRAVGPIPGWKVFANGLELLDVPAGLQALQTVKGLRFTEPGAYHFRIESSDGRFRGVANPVLVDSTVERIYWGDTHGHSGFAEGVGTADRFMQWAKDDARLDYVTHSEHDIWLDDAEWQTLIENVQKYSEKDRFVAYLGYEWTSRNQFGGHHNVLFRTPDQRQRVPVQFFPTLTELYHGLRQQHAPEDVVIIPHAHQTGNYRLSDPDMQPLVEIMSQHGTFEWFGRYYLNHGHEVGFTAASDNHLSQPGYTAPIGGSLSQRGGLGAVFASKHGRDEIFDALRNKRSYATTGDRIILDVALNDAAMGSRVPFSPARDLQVRVIGTAPIERVDVVKNGELLTSKSFSKKSSANGLATNREETFELRFYSAAEPYHKGDNPRGWRPWRGTLTLQDAELLDLSATDFVDPNNQLLRIDAENPNLVHFATATRGERSTIRLKLKGRKETAQIRVKLQEDKEFGGGPPFYRVLQTVPATEFSLSLKESLLAESGTVEHQIVQDSYVDRVSLGRMRRSGPKEVTFAVSDEGDRHGDYYYVRVLQSNDAMAWSSPIWVGGHRSR